MTRAAKDLGLDISSAASSEAGRDVRQPHDRSAPLAARIAAIKSEARRDPQAYLRETVVPEGGE